MNIQEIKKRLNNVEIKEAEQGKYAEIYLGQSVYIHVYDNDYSLELYKSSRFICIITGVYSIEELTQLIKLMGV